MEYENNDFNLNSKVCKLAKSSTFLVLKRNLSTQKNVLKTHREIKNILPGILFNICFIPESFRDGFTSRMKPIYCG